MHKIVLFLLSILLLSPVYGATLINDSETETILTQLVTPLATAANISPDRLRIHIVNDEDFNAFVRGGEDIYVYTGLLKQIRTPSALQAVIAHELGHTIGGHMAQLSARMDAEMKRTMLVQALGIGLMVAGGNPSLGAGVLAGSGGIASQSMMAFSRDEERIADNLGIDLMIKADLNPHGFITVFEQMHDQTGVMEGKINPTRINHPLTRERLNNATDQLSNHQPLTPDTTTPEFEMVRAKLIGYLDTPKTVLLKYPYADKSDAALYARAIANMRGGNLDGARIGTQTLISRHPNNGYFYELLGDIEYQFGHYDDSVDAYRHALTLLDSAPQIETALALVLSERKKPSDIDQAISLCKRSILSAPTPLAYWVLARSYGDTDPGRNAWAMAEYYSLIGDPDMATTHAKRARQHLTPTDAEYIKSGDLIK